jgi:hypothetical protein
MVCSRASSIRLELVKVFKARLSRFAEDVATEFLRSVLAEDALGVPKLELVNSTSDMGSAAKNCEFGFCK